MNGSSPALLGLASLLLAACTGCSSSLLGVLDDGLRSPFGPEPTPPSTPTAAPVASDDRWAAFDAEPSMQLAEAPSSAASVVRVNGRVLGADDLARLGAAPGSVPAGEYWYDARSGLWGVVGDGARGQVAAGLSLGRVDAKVSRGNTGVLINGREITATELALVQRVTGPIARGRYFLNADGAAGPEGGAAVVNLFRGANGGASGRQASYFGHSGIDSNGGGFYDPATGDSYYSFTDSSGKSYSTN